MIIIFAKRASFIAIFVKIPQFALNAHGIIRIKMLPVCTFLIFAHLHNILMKLISNFKFFILAYFFFYKEIVKPAQWDVNNVLLIIIANPAIILSIILKTLCAINA